MRYVTYRTYVLPIVKRAGVTSRVMLIVYHTLTRKSSLHNPRVYRLIYRRKPIGIASMTGPLYGPHSVQPVGGRVKRHLAYRARLLGRTPYPVPYCQRYSVRVQRGRFNLSPLEALPQRSRTYVLLPGFGSGSALVLP